MASQDLFTLYFKYQSDTEPPIIYHRWTLITCLSAYLGRSYWMQFGESKIFPNFYTMLIGHPGARKSTAIKLGKKLLSRAGYDTFAAEKTSKEKFLLDLEGATEDDLNSLADSPTPRKGKRSGVRGKTRDELMDELFGKDESDESKDPREVFIVADEFNEFVGSGNLEFLSLLGALWDWDDELNCYKYRLKNSKSVSIYQPTISILGGNTHAGFVEAFPPQAIGQGFLSRLILVYSDPSGKKIPFPAKPSVELGETLVRTLHQIKNTVKGECEVSKDADSALRLIYPSWKDLKDTRFKHYSNRRFTHLLKLCLVVSAARVSTTITEEDVVLANTILTYTEADMPKALGEFGKSKDSDIASKIMQMLWDTKVPLLPNDIWKQVKNDIDKSSQLTDIMSKLMNSGQVQQVSFAGGRGYLPKQEILDSRQVYVDFELLQEYRTKMGLGNVQQLRRIQ